MRETYSYLDFLRSAEIRRQGAFGENSPLAQAPEGSAPRDCDHEPRRAQRPQPMRREPWKVQRCWRERASRRSPAARAPEILALALAGSTSFAILVPSDLVREAPRLRLGPWGPRRPANDGPPPGRDRSS